MEVTIERILPGGLGMAHAEGRTVMVALAAVGDRVRVKIERVKGTVSFASIQEIITPSPQRVEPPCPYFGRCGGCDFQQLTYEAQLETKKEIIRDCLRRIGGLETVPDFQITPAPNPWHYRSRAQWQYDAVRQRLGYFESASRHVCDVAECAVLVPELQQTLERLREGMLDGSLPDDARDFRAVAGDEGVSLSPDWIRSPTAGERGTSPTVREGSALEKSECGLREVTRTIRNETYHLNAESFFQTNAELLPDLIDYVLTEANGEAAIELYSGGGLFTLPLARRFKRVTAIEADAAAAGFARVNLSNAGVTNTEVANQSVALWLAQNTGRLSNDQLEFLLLDPPRVGVESSVIAGILKLKPKRICYVSCDPATLARDLKKLIAGGYTLESLTAFDLFPQTHHVETVVHLWISPSE